MAGPTHNHRPDGELVLAVQRGDGDAFAELFRRHYPAVRRACTRRLFDAHEADEVAQAAFVRAYERIDQCVGERRFGPWVHVIARSLCMDAFRAQARVEPREQPLAGGRDHRPNEPEESLLSRERVAQMQAALDSLPERQRRAVIARDWEELRPGEIADRLGLSVGAVDSLLLRARRRLAHSYRRLAGEGGGGASTLPVRSAAAAAVVALSLGPQAVMAGTAAAAHAVQDTAGRAAGGVVAAVVSVALTLSGGAEPPKPAPVPPAAATTVATVPRGAVPVSRVPAAPSDGWAGHAADPARGLSAVPQTADAASGTGPTTATSPQHATSRTSTSRAATSPADAPAVTPTTVAAATTTTTTTIPDAPSAPPPVAAVVGPVASAVPNLAELVPAPLTEPAPAPVRALESPVPGLPPVPTVPTIALPALPLG